MNKLCKQAITLLTHSVKNKENRKIIRLLWLENYDLTKLVSRYNASNDYSFTYKGETLRLLQHDYNCGFYITKMTERSLEMAITSFWLKKIKGEIFEVGAVSPNYFPRAVNYVCDPYDDNSAVTHRCSLFDIDFTGKNVLSISTIEHIGTGDYGLAVKNNENSVTAFEKLIKEASKCLITVPTGYNKLLDEYFTLGTYKTLNEKFSITFYTRKPNTNIWTEEKDLTKINQIAYGQDCANGVVVIEKE